MKKMILVVVGLLLLSGQCLALDLLGPPTAGLRKGQWSAGVEYLRSEMDIDFDNMILGGVSLGSATLDDVETDKIYTNFGYGLTDNWEVFLRLGTTKEEDSDSGFTIGGGTKVTVYNNAKEKWGILAQISWTDLDYDDESGFIGAIPYSITNQEIDAFEIQIAFGLEHQLSEIISLYGGPFLHFIDGDYDATATIAGTPYKASADLEQESVFGGYIGAQFELDENVDWNIEFQTTGGGYAIGSGLIWRF